MNDSNKVTVRGEFRLKVFHRDGSLLEDYVAENLVVTLGKSNMARLLGGSVTNRSVTKISFGTDGTAPAATDTALVSAYTKSVDGVTYPDSTSVEFAWSLGTSEANGKDIQEFGLLCNNNELFARRTRAVISKTSDLRLEGTWKIQF